MAAVDISPKLKQKIKEFRRFVNRSPQFKDVIREGFKSRVKTGRQALLNKFRNIPGPGNEDVVDTMSTLLIECKDVLYGEGEIIDVDAELKVWDEMFFELAQIQLDMLARMEEEEAADIFCLLDNYEFCPLCKKGFMRDEISDQDDSSTTDVSCNKCDMMLPGTNTVAVGSAIDNAVTLHSSQCASEPHFMLNQEAPLDGLVMICDVCNLILKLI